MSIDKDTWGGRLARFVTDRPILSVILGLTLWAMAIPGAKHITPNFTHTAFFESDAPKLKAFEAFERKFGNDDAVLLALHSPSGIFDEDSATLLGELTERVWQVPSVIRVDSLANFNWVHAKGDDIIVEPLLPKDKPFTPDFLKERKSIALSHEVLPDYLVSRDGRTAMIFARIAPGFEKPTKSELIVEAARDLQREFSRGDHIIHLHGGPVVNLSFQESSTQDLARLGPYLVGVTVVFLAFLLRTVGGVVYPLLLGLMAIAGSFLASGLFRVEISSVTVTLPYIVLAVSVADAVHILSSFYSGLRAGMDKRAAARYSLSKNFLPTVLTTVTTSIGFLSFMTADMPPVAGLGILSAYGAVLAWFLTYLLLGPAISRLPVYVRASKKNHTLTEASNRAARYVDFTIRHRRKIVLASATLAITGLVYATKVRVNSDPYGYFAEHVPVQRSNAFLLDQMGYSLSYEIEIDAGREDGIKDPNFLQSVEQLEKDIAAMNGMLRTVSIVDILRQMNRSLMGGKDSEYRLPSTQAAIAQELFLYTMNLPQGMDINDRVTVKNDAIRLTVLSSITDSTQWMDAAHAVESRAKELGLKAAVTGKGLLYQSMNDRVVQAFVQSLVIAVLAISVLITIVMGSLKLGLIAMLPNLIPLFIGGAVLSMMGANLDIGTVLVSSVCLGISVDDTIHMLANFGRHRQSGHSTREALARVFSHTIPALVVTTLVLVAAFGMLGFGSFVPNQFFGIMSAIILSTALVADLIFLPALLSMSFPDPSFKGSTSNLDEVRSIVTDEAGSDRPALA